MADTFDLKTHQQTWRAFVRLLTYSAATALLTLALMAIFLV